MQKMAIRHTLTIILGLLFFASCNNRKSERGQTNNRELVPNPEKYVHDGYSELPDPLKPKFVPDTTIGQISLINPKNIDKYLGENVMDRLVDNGLPNSSVISSDSRQRLTFFFHAGSSTKEFSEFQINYVDQNNRNEKVTDDKEFKTENGIKLGMTMGDLRSIKGEPNNITKNGATVFHYKIDDFKNSEFLKKYNMPIYYADYEFENGYLNEFRFGFEYP